MTMFKKIFTTGTMISIIGLSSLSVFASPANPGVPARDGSGGRRGAAEVPRDYDGMGRGQGGQGRGMGIGGMMLQDGSCYTTVQ